MFKGLFLSIISNFALLSEGYSCDIFYNIKIYYILKRFVVLKNYRNVCTGIWILILTLKNHSKIFLWQIIKIKIKYITIFLKLEISYIIQKCFSLKCSLLLKFCILNFLMKYFNVSTNTYCEMPNTLWLIKIWLNWLVKYYR